MDESDRPRTAPAPPGGGALVAVALGLVVAAVTLVGLATHAWGSPDALVSRAWDLVDDGLPRSSWPPGGWPDGVWPDGTAGG